MLIISNKKKMTRIQVIKKLKGEIIRKMIMSKFSILKFVKDYIKGEI